MTTSLQRFCPRVTAVERFDCMYTYWRWWYTNEFFIITKQHWISRRWNVRNLRSMTKFGSLDAEEKFEKNWMVSSQNSNTLRRWHIYVIILIGSTLGSQMSSAPFQSEIAEMVLTLIRWYNHSSLIAAFPENNKQRYSVFKCSLENSSC